MKTWRAKHYSLQLSTTKTLVITLRRFKTSRSRRAKSFRQLVIWLDTKSVKEIAFRVTTRKPRLKRRAASNNLWRLSTSLPLLLVIGGVLGVGFFGNQALKVHALEPVKTFSSVVTPQPAKVTVKTLPYSLPVHLRIPSVTIDADITPVGQASDGSIEMPPVLDWTTGWYKYSPAPGQLGPAIIVGHVDSYKNISVFWRLRYVQPGDIISVVRADDSIATFKVSALKQYDQSDFPTAEVYGNINYAGLRLITCGGTFNSQTQSYTQNTVVYASLI